MKEGWTERDWEMRNERERTPEPLCFSVFLFTHVCVLCACERSPLSLSDGVRLLERLSERVGLSTASVIIIR